MLVPCVCAMQSAFDHSAKFFRLIWIHSQSKKYASYLDEAPSLCIRQVLLVKLQGYSWIQIYWSFFTTPGFNLQICKAAPISVSNSGQNFKTRVSGSWKKNPGKNEFFGFWNICLLLACGGFLPSCMLFLLRKGGTTTTYESQQT